MTTPRQELLPADIERESLQHLINRSAEDFPNIDMALIYAMVDVAFRYGFKMRPAVRSHLRKRITVHAEIIGGGGIHASEILSSSLLSSMRREFNEFRGFKEDLSNLTEPWRVALHDEITALGDPNEETAE
ncbi:MAG TPA: hypothetical protein VFP32_02570 [Candidatus Saccharimonadales bacterium]|nr:hypothetical protein [Candidatus Saccharimonadales bacterium]